ncbi:hypothetical protein [Corynebacterium sp. AOP12-C2-36]|uniref:hypothetical protein n=1 Tax=Corynebacterium sp. AOP12-C2-36 TaxID=3457723 RepID=UPI0040337A93
MLAELTSTMSPDLVLAHAQTASSFIEAQISQTGGQSSGSSTLDAIISIIIQAVAAFAGVKMIIRGLVGGKGTSAKQELMESVMWIAAGVGVMLLGQYIPTLFGLGNSILGDFF